MNTHDVAKSLMHLSRILKAGPNVPLEQVGNLAVHADAGRLNRSASKAKKANPPEESRGSALALLAQIAAYNKNELADLIRHLDIPVPVKATDSVRDLLGRTLKYINENPSVRERLAAPSDSDDGASPVLARALAILLNQP